MIALRASSSRGGKFGAAGNAAHLSPRRAAIPATPLGTTATPEAAALLQHAAPDSKPPSYEQSMPGARHRALPQRGPPRAIPAAIADEMVSKPLSAHAARRAGRRTTFPSSRRAPGALRLAGARAQSAGRRWAAVPQVRPGGGRRPGCAEHGAG